jgi:exonuclease SbcC
VRPVRLQMKGFGAFREPEEIDFSDIDYVALVGPTGSGKSTVIDAMCFALYGCVPRYGDQRRVGYVVTTGAGDARVSFTFDAGGRRYTATRVVQRKPDGKALTREARLEVDEDGGTRAVAGSVGELDALIQGEVLGMPFEHFTRCVVLPQGEFARFLLDKPKDRQDLLVALLGLGIYERMGQRANRLGANLEGQATQLRAQLDHLAFATPEASRQAREKLAELEMLTARLGGARPVLEELQRLTAEARKEAEDAAGLAGALESVLVPAGVAEAGHGLTAAVARHRETSEALAIAGQTLLRAEEELDALGERGPLEAALVQHQQFTELSTELAGASAELTGMAAAAEAAKRRAEEAEEEWERRERALDDVRADRAAHALAERLVVGEPCPVCLSEVASIPAHPPAADLEKAKEAVAAARRTAKETADAASAATSRRTAAEAVVGQLEGRKARLEAALAGAPPENEIRSRLDAITAATAKRAQARQAEQQARQAAARAASELEAAEAGLDGLWRAFDMARDALAALAPPPPGRRDIAADWATFAGWAAAQAPGRREAERRAGGRADELEAQAKRTVGELEAACAAAGVAPNPTDGGLGGLERACAGAEAKARAELAAIDKARQQAAEMAERLGTTEQEATVARSLAQHLSAKGFERWVLTETLGGLVAGASVILRQLSDGAYSLTTDEAGEFWVVDHRNADERRSVRTLSGGETFQASLALALALAEQLSSLAAAGAARIETTFIDEGFGTLDEETLETVASTIENLGGDGRLVGVVTHVQKLAERVPVRLEVSKGPRTASVRKVVV